MGPLLAIENLEIKYHTRDGILTALRNINLDVQEREIVGIVGESGCGKSTVASAVMRLLPPNGQITAGHIWFKGLDLCQLDQEQLRRLRGKDMSMIFQDPMTSLNPVFSVENHMVDALRAHPKSGTARGTVRSQAIEMLKRVDIADPERRVKEFPHQFSGGMRQRIMIAMALMSNPALLIADEPTSALDVTLEAQIVDLIRGLRDELGTAILYITHDLGVVAQLCDRVIVMYAGNIVESGEVYGVFEQPKHPYTRALLRSHPAYSLGQARLTTIPGRVPSLRELPPGCKFAPRCDCAVGICHAEEPPYVEIDGQCVLCHAYLAGSERTLPAEARPRPSVEAEPRLTSSGPGPSDEVVVETRQLRTHFQDHAGFLGQILGQKGGAAVRALDGVDVQVRRGETLAVVGESGSGKTTLGRTILRLENPTDGRIVIEGQDITSRSLARVRPMRARMQMIFQDPCSSLSPRMKVSSILLEPYKIHGVTVSSGKVDELLAMVGLSPEQADKYPHQLSGGQSRRVGIARALALQPDILVADEPTSGLDVSVAAGILNLLKDLREKLNLTYILITHNLSVINFIADRAAVMYLGKIVELAATADLFARPGHPYTEALLSAIAVPDPRLRDQRQRIILKGEIPSPRNPPPGCPFHPRCRYAEARCAQEVPLVKDLNGTGHLAACHFPERVGQMQG